MANFTDHRAWTDLQPHSKILPPNVIVTAEELAVHGEAQITSDLYQLGSQLRKVVYHDVASGRRYYMELVFYVHPAGAANITLANAAGVSQTNGLALLWAGTLSGATGASLNQPNDAVAGFLLSHYYTSTATPVGAGVHYVAPTLTAGDGIWLVRRGLMEVVADVHPIVAGDQLVLDAGSSGGRCGVAVAYAASVAGIEENTTNIPGVSKCVGIARTATTAAAGEFVLAEIMLPDNFIRP